MWTALGKWVSDTQDVKILPDPLGSPLVSGKLTVFKVFNNLFYKTVT